MKIKTGIPWIQDEVDPQARSWEEFYRNRWQHDKVVRSTHGVNCTGGCTWQIHVKNGIVTWEMQGLDYPSSSTAFPPYEPRGCQRGISYSWYLYSPLRVKYPVHPRLPDGSCGSKRAKSTRIRWRPGAAWSPIPRSGPGTRRPAAKAAFRRTDWDTVLEIMAAANVDTIRNYGPDRIAGFSPIPAMSMISYASGARMLQLMGGVALSFYDWYCDLPNASPETWGEQTDVAESADWYHAKLMAVDGIQPQHDPDARLSLRGRGATQRFQDVGLLTRLQPGLQVRRRVGGDQRRPGRRLVDGRQPCAAQRGAPRSPGAVFHDYIKQVQRLALSRGAGGGGGRLSTRADGPRQPSETYSDVENGDWKFLMWDEAADGPKMPMGSSGFRWGKPGQWNLKLEDGVDGSPIAPRLSFSRHRRGGPAGGIRRLSAKARRC